MIFLLSYLAVNIALGEQLLMNCPRNQVKFEKIIGLRPSNSIHGYLLHKNENDEPVTIECLVKCLAKDDCVSLVLYYNISECYWYNFHLTYLQEHDNVIDPDAAWFEKVCYGDQCEKLWIFERLPGAILVGHNALTLPNRVTRYECQRRCLEQPENTCRSTKYQIFDKPDSNETLGVCTISYTDRHLIPNSYRVSSYNEEYFENQCSNITTNEFCAYEEYENVILSHADIKLFDQSQAQCENACESQKEFNCRGYSLIPTKTYFLIQNGVDDKYDCLIHSEDSKIHGPSSFKNINGAHFYEKARCLNISVTCTETYITISYRPEVSFNGKIYMNGYSENLECFAMGKGFKTVTLKMPLTGNQCGITEARSTNHVNRTLLSGTMILQYNSLIQTQGDRLIKVGCIFSTDNTVILGTGVNFANTSYLNHGTTIFNTTSNPTVEMQIVDFYTQTEVADTQIGQELQLVIAIKPPNASFDIWAGHLIAMTEDGHDSILLLDDSGCPTNLNVFPELTKIVTNENKKLVANFQAFKFSSSPIVRFSVIVQFCPLVCAPVMCDYTVKKKRKRQATTFNEPTVTEITRLEYENQTRDIVKMPLEYILLVRNSKLSSDRLVYGENSKILVAGYDLSTNEVCIDYSLLIGIIITWTLTQIILISCCLLIIRRYKKYYKQENTTQSLEELHKNFGLGFSNLEPRRVHWADNYDFT